MSQLRPCCRARRRRLAIRLAMHDAWPAGRWPWEGQLESGCSVPHAPARYKSCTGRPPLEQKQHALRLPGIFKSSLSGHFLSSFRMQQAQPVCEQRCQSCRTQHPASGVLARHATHGNIPSLFQCLWLVHRYGLHLALIWLSGATCIQSAPTVQVAAQHYTTQGHSVPTANLCVRRLCLSSPVCR